MMQRKLPLPGGANLGVMVFDLFLPGISSPQCTNP
jgi:hypothetical protein